MAEGFKIQHKLLKPKTYYYKAGDECAVITGGWGDGLDYRNGSKAKNADTLYLNTTQHTDNSWRSYATNNAINVTSLSKLYVEASISSGVAMPETGLHFGLSSSKTGTGDAAFLKAQGNLTTYAVYELDVSALSGSYYITINAVSQYPDNVTDVYIKNVWGV